MNAKKVIAVLMILLAATSVFAKTKKKKKSSTLEVGGTGTIGVPAGSTFANDYFYPLSDPDTKAFGAFDWGLGALVHLSLDSVLDNLGAQAEVHFYSNAITGEVSYSAGVGVRKKEYTYKYKTIDLPVFATYSIAAGDFTIMPEAGAYLSIPVGKMKMPENTTAHAMGVSGFDGDKSVDTPVVFGLLFGVEGSYPVGPGRILVDLRYTLDLAKIKVNSEKFMTRRGLLLSAGYKVPLDF